MSDPDRRAVYLAAAEQLEAWAATLPRWDPGGSEPWHVFADRRYEAENAVLARLRRESRCEVNLCAFRVHVRLVVAGLEVSTRGGLDGALRAWAASARARWSEAHPLKLEGGGSSRLRAAPPCVPPAACPTAKLVAADAPRLSS